MITYENGPFEAHGVSISRLPRLAIATKNWRILLIALAIFESDGLISHLFNVDVVLAGWFYSGLMVIFLALSILKIMLYRSGREIKSFYYPLIAFFVVFTVSAVSGELVFPKPTSDWLPSLYVFMPIFVFYFLYFIGATAEDVMLSLVVVSVVVTSLLLIDQLNPLPILDEYQRLSIFSQGEGRRIVILKNEAIFGFLVVVSAVISGSISFTTRLMLGLLAIGLFFAQVLIMESRMGFMAMGVAVLAMLHLRGVTKRVFRLAIVLFLVSLVSFPLVFARHYQRLSTADLLGDEVNVSIRVESVRFLFEIFQQSYGWGVGMMSPTGNIDNILHSDGRYNIADTGAFSSLGQFGIGGMLVWIIFTSKCIQEYRRRYKDTGRQDYFAAAAYGILLGFTISLLPLSFFTQAWCVSIGGMLLYLHWFYRHSRLLGSGTTIGKNRQV